MMRDFERMRREGVQLAAECVVTLERIEKTTSDKAPSLIMSVEWLDEVEAKVKRARWLLRQTAVHARKRTKVEVAARRLPVVTETMWRRLPTSTRSQLLLLVRKEEVLGRPGGSLVLYVLQFNVELAASIAKSLALAARPRQSSRAGTTKAG